MKEKVLLDISSSNLVIDFRSDFEKAKNSRRFFEFLLNFNYSEKENKFSIFIEDHEEILGEALSYLEKENIPFDLSESLRSILDKIDEEDKRFLSKVKNAEKVKKDNFVQLKLSGFKRTLKNYQNRSYKHLIEIENGAVFSVPGSGKTTVAYAYFNFLLNKNYVGKLLIIGPRSTFVPWEEEYVSCFGRKPRLKRITGTFSQRERIYNNVDDYSIFIVTYQTAANDVDNLIYILKKFKFLLILDESHYIKRLLKGYWSSKILKLSQFAKVRLILTGTPAPNGHEDLWNQINFLWPKKKILGTVEKFKSKELAEVRKNIYPFYSRTSKRDLSLPTPTFERIGLELSPIQRRIYESIAVKFITELGEPPEVRSKLREWRKVKIVRLLEASTNPSLLSSYSEEFRIPPINIGKSSLIELIEGYSNYEIPPKFNFVMNEIRKTIQDKEKIIIWTNFILNIKTLSKMLKKENIPFSQVYGEIPKDFSENQEKNREKEISNFKNSDAIKVLLANPSACSESISLHMVCKKAIYFDRTFNCGQYMQSLDRIHRLGLMPSDKIVYKILISKDTIDEVIDERLEEKIKTMSNLLSEEISLGSLDDNPTDVIGREEEEQKDFEVAMENLRKNYGNEN